PRSQCRLADRGISRAQVAEASRTGKAQAVGQTHQIVHVRRHVLAIAGVGVTFENLLRTGAESEVAGKGVGLAARRVALTAGAALAATDTGVHVYAVAGFERGDFRSEERRGGKERGL